MPVLGYGTKLLYGDGEEEEAFTEVEAIKESGGLPTGKREDVEVTTLDAPTADKVYMAGLGEPDDLTFDVYFDPSVKPTHVDIMDLKESGEVRNWKMIFPDATETEFPFQAYVKQFDVDKVAAGDPIVAKCAIRISGAVTMTGYES